jgi:carbonic anhydrase
VPNESWGSGLENEQATESLNLLQAGHQRFIQSMPLAQSYTRDDIGELWKQQRPIAAVISCCDSRVSPEILFDQQLGQLFVSRVPGNVASDSAKWMLEIAVSELKVPVILVLGHIGCLAIGQMVDNKVGLAGGSLRFDVHMAIHRARMKTTTNVYSQAVEENVQLTIENLVAHSHATRLALDERRIVIVGAVYEMETGDVRITSKYPCSPEENS